MKKYKVMYNDIVLFTDNEQMAREFIKINERCLLFVFNDQRKLYQLKRSKFDD